ncbi:MAG: hypothetical protein RBU37_11840 [Myxococcota bacterium]|nr:hypothetical protein [Myxococcota bacterium]
MLESMLVGSMRATQPFARQLVGTGQAPNGQELGGTGQAPNGQELGGTGQAPKQQEEASSKGFRPFSMA